MFWERLVSLCKERGTTPTKLVRELNIAHGCVTLWRNGSVPRGTNLTSIAEYFDVSVDYLLGKTDIRKPTEDTDDGELADYLQELKTRPEMKMLFSLCKGATKEDVEQAVAIIEALRKSKN